MSHIKILPAILTIVCLCSARIPTESPVELLLADAIEQKVIEVSASTRGGIGENNMAISVRNLTSRKLLISMPNGTLFQSKIDELQNMLVMEPVICSLSPQSTEGIEAKGFCIEAADRSPDDGSAYTFAVNTNPKLDSLVGFVSNHPELLTTPDLIQSALWAVTDNSGVSSIYAKGNQVVEELRKLCCRLSNQDDVWYNTERNIWVTDEGQIVSEPLEISGTIKIQSDSALKVRCFLVDEEGEEVWSYPRAIDLPSGEIETWFKLTVQNWPMGKYTLYYNSETETLLAQEFMLE